MIPVCAAVILRSGKVLLARRGKGREHAGKWEFPGGRVEPGETSASALARELAEELGIVAAIGAEIARARHADGSGEIELIAHIVTKFTGELTLTYHDQVAWVSARRLLEYDLAPAEFCQFAQLAIMERFRQLLKGRRGHGRIEPLRRWAIS